MANEYVSKVLKESKDGYYSVYSKWDDNGFSVKVTSENGAWQGEMTEEMVKTLSSQLNHTPESYLEECKKMLTLCSIDKSITHSIEDNKFIWKKIEDEDCGIKVRFGSVSLQPTNLVETLKKMLDVSIQSGCCLKEQLTRVCSEQSEMKTNLENLWEKLNNQIKLKNDLESSQLDGFIKVLNEKKKRIVCLEHQLEEQKGTVSLRHEKNNCNKGVVKKRKKEVIIEEVDPYDVDTEDDEDNLAANISNASTSKADNTDTADNFCSSSNEQSKETNSTEDELQSYLFSTPKDQNSSSNSKSLDILKQLF